MNRRSQVKKTTKAISKKKETREIVLSFNKGLNLLAEAKEFNAYKVYHEAIGRACNSDNYRAILEGIKNLRDYVTKRGIQLDQSSPFLELLGGQLDLMRLLAYSKNWGQELRSDIFESICIPGQKVSEEDLRKIRSMLKKKGKKGSGVSINRGHKPGGNK
jgi:hypothetical protein